MTTTQYLLNGLFVLAVLRQARTRRLTLGSVIAPFALMLLVAQQYIHGVPTDKHDLAFIGGLVGLGLTLGIACGFATYVGYDAEGTLVARVGWLAGILLVAGIGARMAFAFAMHHGAAPAVRDFSVAHHIGAAAWPVALVGMALCEVAARLLIVQARGRSIVPS